MSIQSFLDDLSSITITGVTSLDCPPASLNGTALPVMWVQLPRTAEEIPMTISGQGGWIEVTAEIVVAVNSIERGTQETNFAATTAMMDTLRAAIKETYTGKTKLSWSIAQGGVQVAGIDYWAVRALVTGKTD